jgi:hypothetical protein
MALPERAGFVALQRVGRGNALLGAADVEQVLLEVHLVPSQGAQFGDAQAMAVGRQDHGGVPVAVAVAGLGRLHQVGHFGGGEIFARVALTVGDTRRGGAGRLWATVPFSRAGSWA